VRLQAKGVAGLLQSKPSDWQVLKPSSDLQIDPGYLSEPRSIEFPTDGGLTAFMNFYPPKNKDYAFPQGELPALVGRPRDFGRPAVVTVWSSSCDYSMEQ
jgi:hypothetical protein